MTEPLRDTDRRMTETLRDTDRRMTETLRDTDRRMTETLRDADRRMTETLRDAADRTGFADKVRGFWSAYSRREADVHSLMNLEPDAAIARRRSEHEMAQLAPWLITGQRAIDLGAGVGLWSAAIADRFDTVVAVERERPFVDRMGERFAAAGPANVEVVCADVVAFEDPLPGSVDLVVASGVTLYLSDDELTTLAANIGRWLRPGGRLVHRDSVGRLGRYELDEQYSERLAADYSAVYRTRQEYEACFAGCGLERVHSQDMYPDCSPENRWAETRLYFGVFERPEVA